MLGVRRIRSEPTFNPAARDLMQKELETSPSPLASSSSTTTASTTPSTTPSTTLTTTTTTTLTTTPTGSPLPQQKAQRPFFGRLKDSFSFNKKRSHTSDGSLDKKLPRSSKSKEKEKEKDKEREKRRKKKEKKKRKKAKKEAEAAKERLPVASFDDLEPDLKRLVAKAKISEEEGQANLLVLLNCLLFVRKRRFLFYPGGTLPPTTGTTEEGSVGASGSGSGVEVVYVGGEARGVGGKEKGEERDWDDLPPIEELCVTHSEAEKDFKTMEMVGEGGFGRVYRGRRCGGGSGAKKVAIKKMSHVSDRDRYTNLKEVEFLKKIDHPNVVRFVSAYVYRDELWLITEFMEGGTLTEATNNYAFQDKDVAFVAKELLKGLLYLHSRNLIHRDLKSANVMMTVAGEIKLIDFGLCIDVTKTDGKATSMVGSPFWMPPEMIKRQPYTNRVDIWSFAMCLIELANREPPFYKRGGLKAMFMAGTVGYPQPLYKPEKWSPECKDFLGSCLETDPDRRPSAAELLTHPFLDKANSKKGMKEILSSIFLRQGLESMGF